MPKTFSYFFLTSLMCSFVLNPFLILDTQRSYAASYHNADVCFEIEKRRGENALTPGLFLKIYNKNRLMHEAALAGSHKQEHYSIKNKEGFMHVKYRDNHQTLFAFHLDREGNVFLDSLKTSPLVPNKVWGLKTFATLTNTEDLRLKGLYTQANRFLNKGSLLLETFSFSQIYGINQGIIVIRPTEEELKTSSSTETHNSQNNFNPSSIKSKLPYLRVLKEPRVKPSTFDNCGYFVSQKGLCATGLRVRNYGLLNTTRFQFKQKSSLTVHHPIVIQQALEGHPFKITNHSYLFMGATAPTFNAEHIRNNGFIVYEGKPPLKAAHFLQKGFFFSPTDTSSYPEGSELFMPPLYRKDTKSWLFTNPEKEWPPFYLIRRHVYSSLMAIAVKGWVQQRLPSQTIEKHLQTKRLQNFFEKLANVIFPSWPTPLYLSYSYSTSSGRVITRFEFDYRVLHPRILAQPQVFQGFVKDLLDPQQPLVRPNPYLSPAFQQNPYGLNYLLLFFHFEVVVL